MSKPSHKAGRQAYAGVARARRATVRHGIVIAGACVAFGAVLALEGLVSSALEVKIECSSKGMNFASWMSESKWEQSERSGSVTMSSDGFLVTLPVDDCDTAA
jgi:hypothetical protein